MLLLRLSVLAIAVIFAAAQTVTDNEDLTDSFYGLDSEAEPTELTPSEPTATDLPEVDGGRGGRGRHHHRGRHHGHHGRHGGGRRGGSENWTDEQKMTHLCSKIQPETTTTSGRSRHNNRLHWKLRSLNETMRQTFINLWNSRKQALQTCCNQATMPAKLQCVTDAKAARYDRVCNNEEPLCHWSLLRSSSSSSRSSSATTPATADSQYESSSTITTRCCALSGTARVQCFVDAKNYHRQRWAERHQSRSPSPRGHSRGRD